VWLLWIKAFYACNLAWAVKMQMLVSAIEADCKCCARASIPGE